jgi:hypothetical protein
MAGEIMGDIHHVQHFGVRAPFIAMLSVFFSSTNITNTANASWRGSSNGD